MMSRMNFDMKTIKTAEKMKFKFKKLLSENIDIEITKVKQISIKSTETDKK